MTKQVHALIGGVPRLDDDVVEFVAKEIVDNMLVLVLNFEEVGENAGGRGATLHRARLKQAADGVGGVAMLGDHGFKRGAFALVGGEFGAHLVKLLLTFRLSLTLRFEIGAS